jgi:hypothetical protein
VARKRRQLVLMGPDARAGGSEPLGPREKVSELLARFNTAPDGSPPNGSAATEFLYGPGMVVELPTTMDVVSQAIATLADEDIAMPVLMRACRELRWRMMDIESGRMFGG